MFVVSQVVAAPAEVAPVAPVAPGVAALVATGFVVTVVVHTASF